MLRRILKRIRESERAFRVGLVLLIINPPIGWIGFAVGGYLTVKYNQAKFMVWATIIYAITWGMSAAGVILAGPRGVLLAKKFVEKLLRRIFRQSKTQTIKGEIERAKIPK